VLKDNDLRTRMRIGAEEGVELYEQLRDDSLFLCDLGIMDYSLLLGVMDIEFAVDQPARPSENTVMSERTAANTASNTGHGSATNSLTNDSFVSASSSGWSSSTGDSSSADKHARYHEEDGPAKLAMSAAPSVHSLFKQPEDPLAQSRFPSTGGEPRPKRSMRKSKRVFGPGYYYVGIIDILQTWTLQKQLERFWKVNIQQKDGEGLSAIDPVHYQRRFETKLREIIAIPKEYHHRQRRNQPAKLTVFESVQRLSPVLQAAAAFENAAAAKEARRDLARARGDSTDTDASGTSSSTAEEIDLEQAGRNPQPILLPFNQRLITTNSTRSQLSLSDLAV